MIKLLLAFVFTASSPSDSLRVETINGKQFIIHQIEAKETLYSISRRYKVAVTAILENNPSSETSLAVGRLLRVPYTPTAASDTKATKRHVVAAKETIFSIARQYGVSTDELIKANQLSSNSLSTGQVLVIPSPSSSALVPAPTEIKSANAMHTVAAKETMYSIARQYGITVQQLKEWNNLQDELPIGKTLLVVQPKYDTPSNAVTSPKPTTPTSTTAPIKISENVIGTDEINETGAAEVMEGTEASRKYLALHRSIKPGTILKVRNDATNREVFVRVTGVLPPSAASDVIVRISKSAYDKLGATDAKFRIELIYFK